MGKVIGIDLGTTNSCVAIMEGSEAVVIPNSEGSRTTPSIVAFTDDEERLVGQIAKRQAITNPENTIVSIKRLMGRRYDTDEVRRFREMVSFKVIEAPNGDVRVKARGTEYSPPEISAMVLQRMRVVAEEYLGEKVTEAVITVPAYFDDAQRNATKNSGKIAGLDVLRVINEPTAASLAYGLDQKQNQKIAVYDLGGGTFDISILEIGDGIFEVLSTNGDTFLGGDDFDQSIMDWLADEFLRQEGIDLRDDRMALQRLKEQAEKAKCELSTVASTEINLPFVTADDSGPKHLNMTLSQEQLEEMTNHLVQRTLEPCRNALVDAELTVEQIDSVILVGGQTRMPRVQKSVEEFFQRQASHNINPDEVVATGAAIQGGVLTGDVKDILLLDVTALSLGIETLGSVFTRQISRNTTIPTKASQIFTTAEDNQTAVAVHVLQGERELAIHNKSLARFELTGIPPAPRGVPQIEVIFSIDANGIVHVSARDLATKKEQTIQITAASGLTDEEIGEIVADAEAHADEDRKRKEVVQARNSAETLIYTTQKALSTYGDQINPPDKKRIEEAISKCKIAVELREVDKIVGAVRDLREASHKLAQVVYGGAAPAAAEQQPVGIAPGPSSGGQGGESRLEDLGDPDSFFDEEEPSILDDDF